MPYRARVFGAVLLAVAALCACTSMEQCLDLDDQSPGERHEVGAIIHTSNTDLTVEPFQWIGGTWFSAGRVRTDDRRYAMGSGTELNLDNASIALAPSHVLKRLSFLFADKGGNENLRINSALANVAKLTSLDGALLGGVQVQIDWFTNGPIDFGQVFLVGPIVDFAIGGQELWIDDLCFWSTDVPVKPKTWARSYGSPGRDSGWSILATSDAGAVVAAMTSTWTSPATPTSPTNTYLWILKLDDDGAVEWQRTYGAIDWHDGYAQLAQAQDGSLLVSYIVANGTRLLRLSSLGEPQWARQIRTDGGFRGRSMSLSPDGSIHLAGSVWGPNPLSNNSNAFVMRLDPSGAIRWGKRYATSGMADGFYAVTSTEDGGCAAVGSVFGTRGWIVKLDALGNVEWGKSMPTPMVILTSVLQTGDGGYLATGYVPSTTPTDVPAILVMQLDAAGSVSWQKSFGGAAAVINSAVALASGFMVGCTFAESAASGNFLMIELNQDGDEVRQRGYGGSAYESYSEIAVAADGGYFLAGDTGSFGAGDGEVWVCKLAPDGSIAGPCTSSTTSLPGSDLVQPLVPDSVTISDLTTTVTSVTITPIDTQATVMQQCPQP